MDTLTVSDNLPAWVLVILLILNLFKQPLGQLLAGAVPQAIREHFRHLAERQADREEFEQSQQSRLTKTQELEKLQRLHSNAWLEEQYTTIIAEMQSQLSRAHDRLAAANEFDRNVVLRELDAVQGKFAELDALIRSRETKIELILYLLNDWADEKRQTVPDG